MVSHSAASSEDVPTLAVQEDFWNEWNLSHLASADRDSFQLQQQGAAQAAVTRSAAYLQESRPIRILDFGCGTGWLGASLTSFGDVTGIDLSSAAIQHGQTEFPEVHLIAGDFHDAQLVGPFDVIISSDVIAHVENQQAYIAPSDFAASWRHLPDNDTERFCVTANKLSQAARPG